MDNKYTGWRTSTHSGSNPGDCVEVGCAADGRIGVRDTKDHHGPVLTFPSTDRTAFVNEIQGGAFRRPAQ